MRTFEKNVAGAIILSRDERLLMGKKRPGSNGVYVGYWILPGGVVEEGQTPLETLSHEIPDETGLDLSAYGPELVDDEGVDTAELILSTGEKILYQMKFSIYRFILDKESSGMVVRPGDELGQIEWVSTASLANFNLCPPSVVLFHKLGYLPLGASLD